MSYSPRLFACEPCSETLNFEESLRAAELVAIARRTHPTGALPPVLVGGPDTLRIELVRVLKGTTSEKEITVNAWDGMCEYGVVISEKEHLVVLERKGDQYDAVNHGCAFKQALIEADKVKVLDKEYSISEVVALLESVRN